LNIGPRTLKTGIAVALSVYICVALNIEPPLFAAASAVVCMQKSVGKSLSNAIEQILVNVTAVLVAVALGLTIYIQPISMALATIIMIIVCTKIFKVKNQIVLAVITSLFILSSPQEQFLTHAIARSLAILVGLGTANAINLIIAPPHYQNVFIDKLVELNNFAVQHFRDSVSRYIYFNASLENDVEKSKTEFDNLYHQAEKLLDLYQNEWNVSVGSRQSSNNSLSKEEQLYRDYLNYNKGLWQRSLDLIFLAEERKVRREKANAQAVSCEFNHIFEMQVNVLFNAMNYNSELQKKIRGEEVVIYPEPLVWCKLDKIINEWQESTPSTNFYMHALIEISIITYNIRWFAKESTRMLNL